MQVVLVCGRFLPSPKSLLPDSTGGEPMVKAARIPPLGFPFDKIGAFL